MSPRTGTSTARRLAAAGTGAALLAVTAAGIAAASLHGPLAAPLELGIPAASVPAGDFVAECPRDVRLPAGTGAGSGATDPDFAAGSDSARTAVRASVLSDVAARIPGAALTRADGTVIRRISPELPEGRAAKEAATSEEGLSGLSAVSVSGVDEARAAVLRVQPLGGLKSQAGMVRSYRAGDGDLAGLAVSRCQDPANEQWLVGASTVVGRTALLVVSNPSPSASTVDVELFGAEGQVEAGALRGIALAPGESTSIVLAGVAAGEPALGVRVASAGAPVTAVIQQSVLRGLTAGGVDFIEPGARPSQSQVVPGVAVQSAAATRELSDQRGYADAAPELHVAVPGRQDAALRVRAFGPAGEVTLPGGGAATAAAGTTARIALDALPVGDYTIAVEADQPVAAGVRLIRGTAGERPVDAAWASSGERLGSQHLLMVPELAVSRIVFGAPEGAAEISLRPVAADGTIGAARTLSTAAGTTAPQDVRDLGAGTVAVLVGASGDPVYAAQVLTAGASGVSSIGVPPATGGRRDVAVEIGH
ncbi:MAG: DUF5719 family protein [Arthrobacter sp.]|uniref:DUF5719 family protein n=1 Tax=Arthrobacter sp. TaxID=1667 RepID=UPI0034928F10